MRNERSFRERITPHNVIRAVGATGLTMMAFFSVGKYMAHASEHTRQVMINTMASAETHTPPTTIPGGQLDQLNSDINSYNDIANIELLEAGAALAAVSGIGLVLTRKPETPVQPPTDTPSV